MIVFFVMMLTNKATTYGTATLAFGLILMFIFVLWAKRQEKTLAEKG
jgi:hypothetical protein